MERSAKPRFSLLVALSLALAFLPAAGASGTGDVAHVHEDGSHDHAGHDHGPQPASDDLTIASNVHIHADGSSHVHEEPVPALAPAGFEVETVFSGLTRPTEILFANTGHIFVSEKNGRIYVWDDINDTSRHLVADLRSSVYDYTDHGLLGMEIDPDWPASPYLYVLYTHDSNPWTGSWNDGCPDGVDGDIDGCPSTGRLSRLTIDLSGNNPTMASGGQTVLIGGAWCHQFFSHSIGKLVFDGTALYASAGDGATPFGPDWGQHGGSAGGDIPANPCDDPPGGVGTSLSPPSAEGGALRAQDLETSGDPVTYSGSVIRVDRSGNALPGNPLFGGSSGDDAVVAYGFRNPYAMTVRPGTGEVWVGDTGWNTWEEINVMPNLSTVRNFGWPCYEGGWNSSSGGFNRIEDRYENNDLDICVDHYTGNSTVTPTAPFFAWPHSDGLVGCGGPGGRNGEAVTGLAFYPGGDYPPVFDGALFVANYAAQCVIAFPLGSNGQPDPSQWVRMFDNTSPVSLKAGPGGEIWGVDIFAGTVVRLTYDAGNLDPNAVIAVDATSGPVPFSPTFDATGSNDFEDPPGALTYEWDLDGDGTFETTGITANPTYNQADDIIVALRVTDTQGASDIDTVEVHPGNSAPVITNLTPSAGFTWDVGDQIAFSATATDADETLPDAAYSWEINLHHCVPGGGCHVHFIGNPSGPSGSFVAPTHEYPSFLELVVTVVDSKNETTTTNVEMQPNTIELTLESTPTGLDLGAGVAVGTTPFAETVIVNSLVSVSAPDQVLNGSAWRWASWSDGGDQAHEIQAPGTNSTISATFEPDPGPMLAMGVVNGVTSSWQTVPLPQTYGTPVIVATVDQPIGSPAVVTRIDNLTGNSFDLRLQDPSGGAAGPATVRYLVAEQGIYDESVFGFAFEARRFTSTVTDRAGSWNGETRTYGTSFSSPVVLGQVMSYNDTDWSVFWSRGASTTAPPSSSVLRVGKHVAEDPNNTRANELIGYIVADAGTFTDSGGVFEAAVGPASIGGAGAAGVYSLNGTAVNAVASDTGRTGGDGAWAVINNGSFPSTSLPLYVAEDQLKDSETTHVDERVAYVALTNDDPSAQPVTYVGFGSSWRYLDNGSNQGIAWRNPSFNDSSWSSGPAQLGYGDGDEATVVASGPSGNRHITTYFRSTFQVTDAARVESVAGRVIRDDGVVIYVNGTEVMRNNLPGGTITSSTVATGTVGGSGEDTPIGFTVPTGVLATGTNTIAVEIHQRSGGSSDISFDLELTGVASEGDPDTQAPTSPDPVVVDSVTTGSVSLSWTTSTDDSGTVTYRIERDRNFAGTTSSTSFTDTGLEAGTTYGYIVTAFDPSGNQTSSTEVDATTATDNTAPTVPPGLTATAQGSSAVLVDWNASTDDSGTVIYKVRRNGGLVSTTVATSLNDTGLDPETTYSYTVTAEDPTGNTSAAAGPVEATTSPASQDPVLVAAGSVWRYLDNGSNQGTTWRSTSFNDSSWDSGPAQLGYGDGDEATVVASGPSSNKHITTYFRHTFTVADPGSVTGLQLRLKRDDGAVVYLNGTEVARSNMPGGTITSSTTASLTVGGSGESVWHTYSVDPALLQSGNNVLAVEVHQKSATSSDITLDASLTMS